MNDIHTYFLLYIIMNHSHWKLDVRSNSLSRNNFIGGLNDDKTTDSIIPTISVDYRLKPNETQQQSFNPTIESFPWEKNNVPEMRTISLNSTYGTKKFLDNKSHYVTSHSLPKIDTYNPKYLEMLDLNKDRYALVFKNLDLYNDVEVDNILTKLGTQRIADLKSMQNPDSPLIKEVEQCTKVLDPTNPKKISRLCETYLSPVYDEEKKVKLLKKLKPIMRKAKHLSRAKHEIVVNDLHIIEDDLITKEEYEISEGTKIINWIENNLIYYGGYNVSYFNYMLFADLVTYPYKGHIYISKAGVKLENTINQNLIKLSTLNHFYNTPIDISKLIPYISFNHQLNTGSDPGEEAKKILALEYFICLQPQPRYMLYILKRLIVAWYADFDLINTITKIRLLINQYRCRRDKKENIKWGVLPSIVVYLRYGAINFNRALSKINYYFTNYIHTGWVGNNPDYYTKYNDLIYYSNGSPDAKRFFEHFSLSDKIRIYKPYTINPTAFLEYGEDIVTPYPQIYEKMDLLKSKSKFDIERLKKSGQKIVDNNE